MLLRLTALATSSAGTISTTNARRAGLSNAVMTPCTVARRRTLVTEALPVSTTNPNTSDWTIAPTWVANKIVRLSKRSAKAPPQKPSSSTGPNCAAASRPSNTPDPVSSRMRRVCATIVIQVPVWEIVWPMKNNRKLRTRNDRNVSLSIPWPMLANYQFRRCHKLLPPDDHPSDVSRSLAPRCALRS